MNVPGHLVLSPLHLPALALALWMVLAPQVPRFRERREALSWITWIATRGFYAALLVFGAGPWARATWTALRGAARFGQAHGGHAWSAAGAFDRGAGPWIALALLAADFAAWRAVAAAGTEGGESGWNWVASPVVLAFGVALAVPRSAATAFLALALLFVRRGRDGPAGGFLGAAAAWGGPFAAAAALAVLCAPGRRAVRAVVALAGAAVTLAVLRFAAPAAWAWTWAPPADAGAGTTLWRFALGFARFAPGGWAWLGCAVLGAWGVGRLALRGAGAPAMVVWVFASCALLSPSFPASSALVFTPALAAWASDDPDRRGWWVLYGAALSLGVGLEAGFEGSRGPGGKSLAMIAVAGAALLAAWPLLVAFAPPAPSRPHEPSD